MDLFDFNNYEEAAKPLSERMRANTLNEFIGQKHLVAEGSLLRRAIASDRLGSCIFWGPPGCGKTTLANIIAMTTNGEFIKLNAVNSGVADVKKAVDTARENLRMYGKRTYLMLDECHRFSKTQSDSLLPAIEKGTIIFIGSTTENPYASMTPAIVSRCRVFEFKRLTEDEIANALRAALKNRLKGLGKTGAEADDEAIAHIARVAGGDLRTAYNALELAVNTTPKDDDGVIRVRLADAEQSIQQKALSFGEDQYYDYLSAFCKSLRGSDSNAALYYAHRIIEGGGDPMLVARRLVVHSAEDVGLADPRALQITTAAMYALEKIGYPEAMIPLSAPDPDFPQLFGQQCRTRHQRQKPAAVCMAAGRLLSGCLPLYRHPQQGPGSGRHGHGGGRLSGRTAGRYAAVGSACPHDAAQCRAGGRGHSRLARHSPARAHPCHSGHGA